MMHYNELQDNPFFTGVGKEDTNHLIEASNFKQYEKGKMLFIHGDDSNYCYVTLSGWVKLYRETCDGQEAVIGLATTGDIIGESNFDRSRHLFSAETINETSLLKISNKKLKKIVESDGMLASKVISSLNSSIHRLEMAVEHSSTMNAAQCISCFMIRLCGGRLEGSIRLELPFNKTLIASYLGMKRETFSRGLKELKAQGVKVRGGVINIQEIKRLVGFSCVSCSLSPDYCQDCF